MKQEILRDKTQTLSVTPYLNNMPVVSDSSTITVTKPSGEVLVNEGTGTVNSTTGEITYDLSSALNTELGENFQARWTYVISGSSYYQTNLFDVVLNRLAITVVDDDLLGEQNDILNRNESYQGLVDSSSNTTIVDADLKSFEDDYWNGGRIIVTTASTGATQERIISDFTQSSGTVTVSVAWASNPAATATYSIKRGFQQKIEGAFEEMMLDIKTKGYRPALILESSELKVPLTKKALSLICRDFLTQPDDKWDKLAVEYEKQYQDSFAKVQFQYDRDESGTIDSDFEKEQDMGSLRLKR